MLNIFFNKNVFYRLLIFLGLVIANTPSIALADSAKDLRDITTGLEIPDESYCDQPYVVITKDGHWLCVMTTGKKHEGSGGQHIVSTVSNDQGKTWGPLVDIEPDTGPLASWVVPLIVPSGRIYAIYTYNGDNISTLPGSDKKVRSDMLGWYCFKFSDDSGKTWSKRYRIPIRTTAADRGNQWEGKVNIFWGIDKPKTSEMGVTFAFTKLGRWMLDQGEGWMMHSDNILTESDPEKINWRMLPQGDRGIRLDTFGSVQEEHNHVFIGDQQMYMVYRTTTGYPCHVYSRDGGKTWTKPVHMTYAPGGRKIKNPRACPKLFKCSNGKYLFWYHNHSGKNFHGRNPAWVAGGVLRDGKMHWSEPEVLLYSDDLSYNTGRMSYPDLIEQDGKYWITETQKSVARVHEIDPTLFEGMWAQLEGKGELTTDGLVLSLDQEQANAGPVQMPRLPDLSKANAGFTVDIKLTFKDIKPGQLILDSRNKNGKGLALGVAEDGAVRVHFADGKNKPGQWTSDPGLLKAGKTHHITAIVDGGPNIISFVVDGKLCDGGESRQYGWGRFDPEVGDVNGSETLQLSPSFRGEILSLRIYNRYLRTSEAVANYQATKTQSAKASKADQSPPNIVLIFADDLGYGDLGCYGLKTAKTPHLDQLATEGTRYTSFYAQQVCGPSRMALLTGRYPSRVQKGWWSMPSKEVTFAEVLKKAGYTTACIGKWDVSGRKAIIDRMPNAQGFDTYWGPLGANGTGEVEIYDNNKSIGVEKDMAALTRIYTDRSIQWMKEHVEKRGDQPFMLYLSHSMMHTVIDASPKFRDRTGNGLYADTLEEFDHECGRLLKAIDELKLRDNTMVIFTSDNGAWSNDQERQGALNERYREWSKGPKIAWGDSGPLREGKGSDYEGGVRVPCLIRWPGKVAEGKESDAIFATLDILPTFASLAGVDAPKDRIIDGVNQTDLLLGKNKTGNRRTYFYFSGKHGVREGKWKLLYENRWPKSHNLTYPKDKGTNQVELYDLENDLGETTNLADKHPKVVERLLKLKFPKEQ